MPVPNPHFDEAFDRTRKLVDHFGRDEKQYLSPTYSEAQARIDFIDKFWIALGWDVNHEKQTNPYEQEVKVERAERLEGRRGRADYAFFTSPNFRDVRFYAEAKKPARNLDNPDDYFQTIRYGWSSQTPFAVLTDFEQFRVVDCRYKPDIASALDHGVLKFHYSDYVDRNKFAEIYWLFSRDAVLGRSLEKFAENQPTVSLGRARQRALIAIGGYQKIDEYFLRDLDSYREQLARAFKDRNPLLNGYDLTEATQRTLDRLVFIRFLEDKLIEETPIIETFVNSISPWHSFLSVCRRLDKIYNGILFKAHALIDSSNFQIDEKVFYDICSQLSHTTSPYDFNSIPIHILGNIYERFLGKAIVVAGNQAHIEEKPQVRKAGGVYYTPEYIVRHIIENTIGSVIEGKSPKEIREMRFADIACGSGSFLIGAYDYLLRYHTDWYNKNKANHAGGRKAGCLINDDGSLRLSLRQRGEILINNIYGVDIDKQAVEVAQLSLYLKLLEDETPASARAYQRSFREALLPSLSQNIKCGNALIGEDILSGKLFDQDEELKLQPMDFEKAFPEIIGKGGFDALVGNPPYVRIQGFPRNQIEYLAKTYRTATGNFDIYVNFIERGLSLLNSDGVLGEIIPNKFFKTDYGIGLRKLLTEKKVISKIIDFGAHQVFDATTYTCLLFLNKKSSRNFYYAEAAASSESLGSLIFKSKDSKNFTFAPWLFAHQTAIKILQKLEKKSQRLLDLPAQMSRGSSSGNDNIFMLESSDCSLEDEIIRTPVFATDFGRYSYTPNKKWKIIFPYYKAEKGFSLYLEAEIREYFPRTYKYLLSNRNDLLKRKQFKEWFGYSAPRSLDLHDKADIFIPLLANRGMFTLIPNEARGKLCPMASGGFTVTLGKGCKLSTEYILGLLNSKLLFWKLQNLSNIFRGGWITCTKQYFGELPIRTIDFFSRTDKLLHDKITELVIEILKAKKDLAKARNERDKDYFERRCASLDQNIDGLVYELYELKPEEIALIEGQ